MKTGHSLLLFGFITLILTLGAFGSIAYAPSIVSSSNQSILNGSAGSVASSNWGGYVVASTFSSTCTGHGKHQTCTGGASAVVTAVYGSWLVQAVSASSSNTYSSQWVGIGGYFSGDNSLIQTGTESDYTNGAASYGAWYELLPNAETPITMTISPGDVMDASVVCTSSCTSATQTWLITINDVTTSKSFSTSVSYSSSLLSAEWIEERPATCFVVCTLTTLANFGTAHYGFDYTSQSNTNYATLSGSTAPIGSLNYQSITMESCSGHGHHSTCTILAQPSSLTTDGTSFTMTYG